MEIAGFVANTSDASRATWIVFDVFNGCCRAGSEVKVHITIKALGTATAMTTGNTTLVVATAILFADAN
jgi:hypothetical protein